MQIAYEHRGCIIPAEYYRYMNDMTRACTCIAIESPLSAIQPKTEQRILLAIAIMVIDPRCQQFPILRASCPLLRAPCGCISFLILLSYYQSELHSNTLPRS